MTHSKQIANRFREVILNGRWIANTNFKDQMMDLNWQQATTKIGSLNSIAALAFHIDYYVGGVLNVLKGGTLDIRDKYSFDLPPIESEEDWQQLLTRFLENAELFAQVVEKIPDEQLQEAFVDPKYGSYYKNLEGMIEHSYYHLGQVVLIKKMVLERPK